MTDEKFDEYLKERHITSIGYYETQAGRNKRMYNAFQWGVIIISAVMPVMVVSLNPEYKLATAGLSLLLAIGTSGLKAFKFQENWINFRQVAETLKQEKYFYEADLGPYSSAADKRAMFVDRVESLISRENAIWTNLHQQKEEAASNAQKR
ncbi:MAG TPA: DUF4231 domain-containing protein [Blastocatellia bacterium]|nr:DUF4231 domain-containing protein [Blastocatellia bacterium]